MANFVNHHNSTAENKCDFNCLWPTVARSENSSSILVVPLSSTFSGLTVQFPDQPCYSRKPHNKGAKSYLLLGLFGKFHENIWCLTFLVGVQLLMVLVFHMCISNNICILLLHHLCTSSSPVTEQETLELEPFKLQVHIYSEGTITPPMQQIKKSKGSLIGFKWCRAQWNAQFLCFLSHFMCRLKISGAPHGWVKGQEVMYCVQCSVFPVSIRPLMVELQVKFSARPPMQSINLIEKTKLRTCKSQVDFCLFVVVW